MTTGNRNRPISDDNRVSSSSLPAELLSMNPDKVAGLTGLSIWAGFLHEEYLQQLKPWNKEVRVYLEMRDDPVIGTLMDAIKMPLLRAGITVEPSDDSSEAQAAADFVEAQMAAMAGQTWLGHMSDALECLDFGFAFPEIVLEKRDDGHLWIRNLAPRGQETLIKWFVDDEDQDKPVAYMQGAFRAAQPMERRIVPLAKSLHFVFRGRKGSPQGRSFLRLLYRPWKFAKNIETFEGIGVERDVGGMPVLKLPEGMRLEDPQVTEVKKYLKALRMDQAVYMILPFGFELEAYGGGGKTYNTREIVRDYNKQILMRGFAQFLALGMEGVGTQALVKGSQDFFTLAMENIQDGITTVWNEQLVPYLFEWNPSFGIDPTDKNGMPKIVWDAPGDIDLPALVSAMSTARGMDALTVTREDEEFIRRAAGLPELPDGVGEDVRDKQEPAGGGGFPFSEPSKFVASAAGQEVRRLQGRAELATNAFQRELGRIYDPWAKETIRLAALPGRSFSAVDDMLSSRLELLRIDLKLAGRARIGGIAFTGLGEKLAKHADKPQVLNAIQSSVKAFEEFIDASLMPGIRERFSADLIELAGTADKALRTELADAALASQRPRVAFGAGRAWTAIFNAQRSAGEVENVERQARGEEPVPVRWVLDQQAEHCKDDANRSTFGCPTLAGDYPSGWSQLPTVPAGDTSCLGNCRCHLEADFGGGFERL